MICYPKIVLAAMAIVPAFAVRCGLGMHGNIEDDVSCARRHLFLLNKPTSPVVENPCSTGNPCQNGGTCVPGEDEEFSCDCPAGYSGDTCGTNDNDCSPDPCVNGVCIDGVNGYMCNCDEGWEGTNCDEQCDCPDCSTPDLTLAVTATTGDDAHANSTMVPKLKLYPKLAGPNNFAYLYEPDLPQNLESSTWFVTLDAQFECGIEKIAIFTGCYWDKRGFCYYNEDEWLIDELEFLHQGKTVQADLQDGRPKNGVWLDGNENDDLGDYNDLPYSTVWMIDYATGETTIPP